MWRTAPLLLLLWLVLDHFSMIILIRFCVFLVRVDHFSMINWITFRLTNTNMAEIALSALAKQCLDRRIPTIEELQRQVYAWVQRRNQNPVPIRWQFTPAMARDKFQRFYPKLSKL